MGLLNFLLGSNKDNDDRACNRHHYGDKEYSHELKLKEKPGWVKDEEYLDNLKCGRNVKVLRPYHRVCEHEGCYETKGGEEEVARLEEITNEELIDTIVQTIKELEKVEE